MESVTERFLVCFLLCAFAANLVVSLNNGVGITPAMGFMDWERYRLDMLTFWTYFKLREDYNNPVF